MPEKTNPLVYPLLWSLKAVDVVAQTSQSMGDRFKAAEHILEWCALKPDLELAALCVDRAVACRTVGQNVAGLLSKAEETYKFVSEQPPAPSAGKPAEPVQPRRGRRTRVAERSAPSRK